MSYRIHIFKNVQSATEWYNNVGFDIAHKVAISGAMYAFLNDLYPAIRGFYAGVCRGEDF